MYLPRWFIWLPLAVKISAIRDVHLDLVQTLFTKNLFCISNSTGAGLPVINNISSPIQAQHKPASIRSWAPWSREPECLVDEETKEKFCVYTKSLQNGMGISFFTSPSLAILLGATLPQDSYQEKNTPKNVPYIVKNIPGRGNGLFAARTLYRGEEILTDFPLGVYQRDAFFPDYPIGYKYLRKTFDYLPEKAKNSFLRLAYHSSGDPVMERINTNSFAAEFDGKPHFLVYPETSLLNHDCRPNAMYLHDEKTLIHTTRASRTIQAGEEITVSYINLFLPREDRQKALRKSWGFTCSCSHCTRDEAANKASELRSERISQLQRHLADWSSGSIATPAMAEELLSLYAEEQVDAVTGIGHAFAALAYNAVGDIEQAVSNARIALEMGILNEGNREATESDMRSVIDAPSLHWSHMARM